MKLFRISLLTLVAAMLLVSCGGGSAPIISTPIENIDTLPLKIAPLTTDQYKNWGAKDLITDTIPG